MEKEELVLTVAKDLMVALLSNPDCERPGDVEEISDHLCSLVSVVGKAYAKACEVTSPAHLNAIGGLGNR